MGAWWARPPPPDTHTLSKVGDTSGFVPPPSSFGQIQCSNFTICSYFVVKNAIFQNFLGSLKSPT